MFSTNEDILDNSEKRRLSDIRKRLKTNRTPFVMTSVKHHLYDFDSIMDSEWGLSSQEGAYVATPDLLLSNPKLHSASRLRRITRAEYRDTLLSVGRRANILIWREAGWHMSSFKSPAVAAEFRARYPMELNPKFWTERNCQLLQVKFCQLPVASCQLSVVLH